MPERTSLPAAPEAEEAIRKLAADGHEVGLRIMRNQHWREMIHVHLHIDGYQVCSDIDPDAYLAHFPALFEGHLRRMIEMCLQRTSSTSDHPPLRCCFA